jgi:uncharacterized protein YvpB
MAEMGQMDKRRAVLSITLLILTTASIVGFRLPSSAQAAPDFGVRQDVPSSQLAPLAVGLAGGGGKSEHSILRGHAVETAGPADLAAFKLGERAAKVGPVDLETAAQAATAMQGQSSASQTSSGQATRIVLAMDRDFHSQRWETALPNACGPTSLLMVLDYFSLERSLRRVIAAQRISPEDGGYDAQCLANPVCMSPAALALTAQVQYGLMVQAYEGWTFQDVYDALASGRPVIADVTWRLRSGGSGHFVVIYGIDTVRQSIIYHDPYDGPARESTWSAFSASWNGPVDLGDPLQPDGHRAWGMSVTID